MVVPSAAVRILLHALFLISANLFSMIFAFILIHLSNNGPDQLIQTIVAVSINLAVYFLVFKLMGRIQEEIMKIDNISMLIVLLLISLALLPAVFYPLHFFAEGSLITFSQVLAMWPFQLVANTLCLLSNYYYFSGP